MKVLNTRTTIRRNSLALFCDENVGALNEIVEVLVLIDDPLNGKRH